MSFIGKKINEGSKKAKITVSINKGRVGLVFRKGLIAAGTLIDVLIGVDDDYGMLLVKRGEGSLVSAFNNSDNVVSWGASRKASTVYPALKRATATIVSDDEDGLLIKIDALDGLAAAPVAEVAVGQPAEPVAGNVAAEEFGLGLDETPATPAKATPAKPKAVPAKKK